MKMPKINFKDPKFRTVAVIVVLIILGVVYWYQQIFVPKNDELTALIRTKTEKQDRLNAILVMKTQRDRLVQEIGAKRNTLDSLKAIFPDQKEIPRLIQEVTRLARESGMFITKLLPQPDNVREHYVESRYAITMWGKYHDMGEFISRLANLKLIINLAKMKLSAHPALVASGSTESATYTIISTFDLTTFSSKK